ncbi:hypothetical protein SCHPADRAFT_800407, partial [Schizopora paradoxa]
PDQKTDVWAFGMTLLEILTLKVPYAHIISDGPVSKAILEGKPPVESFPVFVGSGDEPEKKIWELCKKCWSQEKKDRPSMDDVLR